MSSLCRWIAKKSPHNAGCTRTHTHTLSGGVLVILDESSQAEIGNFAHQVISHQDVGSSEVSVDVVHPLDEGHAIWDLRETPTSQEQVWAKAAESISNKVKTGWAGMWHRYQRVVNCGNRLTRFQSQTPLSTPSREEESGGFAPGATFLIRSDDGKAGDSARKSSGLRWRRWGDVNESWQPGVEPSKTIFYKLCAALAFSLLIHEHLFEHRAQQWLFRLTCAAMSTSCGSFRYLPSPSFKKSSKLPETMNNNHSYLANT